MKKAKILMVTEFNTLNNSKEYYQKLTDTIDSDLEKTYKGEVEIIKISNRDKARAFAKKNEVAMVIFISNLLNYQAHEFKKYNLKTTVLIIDEFGLNEDPIVIKKDLIEQLGFGNILKAFPIK